jgi:hypothetical protein
LHVGPGNRRDTGIGKDLGRLGADLSAEHRQRALLGGDDGDR